jgi:hypothetical protein
MGQILDKDSFEKDSVSVSTEEIEWLHKTFPGLKYLEGPPSKIVGLLEFEACYENNEVCVIEPPGHFPSSSKNAINDSYHIEIQFTKNDYSSLPQIKETGNRIINYAKQQRIPSIDLHINAGTGTLCLTEPQMESAHLPKGFNLSDYLFCLVIPFLYAHSYKEKYGVRPWEERSHGHLGVLESYSEIREHEAPNQDRAMNCVKLLKRGEKWDDYKLYLFHQKGFKRQWICTCSSGSKFRKCHPKAYKGLILLIDDLEIFPEIKQLI